MDDVIRFGFILIDPFSFFFYTFLFWLLLLLLLLLVLEKTLWRELISFQFLNFFFFFSFLGFCLPVSKKIYLNTGFCRVEFGEFQIINADADT